VPVSPSEEATTLGAAVVLPLLLTFVALLVHRCCCSALSGRPRPLRDAMTVVISRESVEMVLVDASNHGKVNMIDHCNQKINVFEGGIIDPVDFRLATLLSSLYHSGFKYQTIAQAVTIVVPDDLADVVQSRLISGVAKFRGICFDGNNGSGDGTLQNTQIMTSASAACVGCVGIHYASRGGSGNPHGADAVVHHVLLDFRADGTQATLFNVFWLSEHACDVSVIPQVLQCEKVPLNTMDSDPYLTGFMEPVFQPFVQNLLTVFDSFGAKGSTIHCALNGEAASSIPIHNFLSQVRRLSVWIPAKSFQETSLATYGGAIVAAGLARASAGSSSKPDDSELRLQLISTGVMPWNSFGRARIGKGRASTTLGSESIPQSFYSFSDGMSLPGGLRGGASAASSKRSAGSSVVGSHSGAGTARFGSSLSGPRSGGGFGGAGGSTSSSRRSPLSMHIAARRSGDVTLSSDGAAGTAGREDEVSLTDLSQGELTQTQFTGLY
jgi:hypothetical protein